MKKVIITNYSFDSSIKTITFTDFSAIDIRRVVSVTNVTVGQQLYFFKSPIWNGAAVNNTLILNYDTNSSTYSDTDKLIIEYLMDNVPFEVMASSVSTVSNHSADFTCYSKGMMFVFDVTAISGTATPTITPKIQMKDFYGNYIDVPGAVTADLTVAGQAVLTIHPELTVVSHTEVSAVMPRTYRIAWTISGTTPSFTFRVSGQPID